MPNQAGPGELDNPTTNWYDSLSEDLKGNQSVTGYKSVEDLAKGYVELRNKMSSTSRVTIPTEKSTPEEVAEFYKKIGVPESEKGYTDMDASIAKLAHSAKLTPTQAKEFISKYNEHLKSIEGIENANIEKEESEYETLLRTKYGQAYDSRLDEVEKFIGELESNDGKISELLQKAGLDGSYFATYLFSAIYDHFYSESTLPSFDKRTGEPLLTPEEAEAKLADLMQDPGYRDGSHPKHAYIMAEIKKVSKAIDGER